MPDSELKPPKPGYEHAYAIVRIDFYDQPTVSRSNMQQRVTVKRVVWDAETARQEVERLNRVNSNKGCVYFSQVTRVEKRLS